MPTLERLEQWFAQNQSGNRKASGGIRLTTLDNPGWSLEVALDGTALDSTEFQKIDERYRSEFDWIFCRKEGAEFASAGGACNLNEILSAFLDWAEPNSESLQSSRDHKQPRSQTTAEGNVVEEQERSIEDRLVHWFAIHCNDDWEHGLGGVWISSTDTPGWSVEIRFEGIGFEGVAFPERVDRYRYTHDWLHCKVENCRFIATGGARNLREIIGIFLDWVEYPDDNRVDITDLFQKARETSALRFKSPWNADSALFVLQKLAKRIPNAEYDWDDGPPEMWGRLFSPGRTLGYLCFACPLVIASTRAAPLIGIAARDYELSVLYVDDFNMPRYSVDFDIIREIFGDAPQEGTVTWDRLSIADLWFATIT